MMFKIKTNKSSVVSQILLITILTTSVVQLVLSQSEDGLEREDSIDSDYDLNNRTDIESEEKINNSTDYDYEEAEGRDGGCDGDNQPTFLDKWKEIYEQGRNVPINKYVKHINETSEVLKTFKQNLEFLLKPSDNSQERYKALEFFSEIDLGLSSECLTAFTRTVMSIVNGELWALKCEYPL